MLISSAEKIMVSVWVKPLVSIYGKRDLYSLPDAAYGEWLIFNKGVPVYYFNYFESYYDSVREKIDLSMTGNLGQVLTASFVANKLAYTINVQKPLFSLAMKEYSTLVELMRYPASYFDFLQ